MSARNVAICGECAEVALQVISEAQRPEYSDRVVTGIGTVVTQDSRLGEGPFGLIHDAGLVIRMGRVTWVGPAAEMPVRYADLPALDAGGRMVVPGFVDPVTRLFGDSPTDTDDAKARVDGAVEFAGAMLQHGVTTLGLRVGGSADPTTETLALAAARTVADRLPSLVSIVWVDRGSMDQRVAEDVMIPTAQRLASAVEVTCHGPPHIERLLGRLDAYGSMRPHVRLCDEPGPCLDAASGALTVEGWSQLEPVDAAVSVLEPLDLLDGLPLPMRKLLEAGAQVAIASGSDPRRRLVHSPALLIALAVDAGGVTPWHAVWAATRGGALAVGDPERGRLRPGDPADLVILDASDPAEMVRRPDANPAWSVVCNGAIVPT